MSRAVAVVGPSGDVVGYAVRCPACDADEDAPGSHMFSVKMSNGAPGWSFDGNFERPTFSPSMLARWPHGVTGREVVCHSFVRDGRIEYLADCTHALAGQTVELPEWDRD